MRRWDRAPRELLCGNCKNRHIAQGDPVLYVSLPGMRRELQRCVDCEGPAPPDLPPLIERKTPGDFSMQPLAGNRPKTRGALRSIAERYTPHNS